MELQPVVALELRLELLAEFRLAVEACDLVLVLVGQELEVVAGDGLGQRQIIRGVGVAYALHQLAIAPRQPSVLVAGKEVHAPLDDLFQGFTEWFGDLDWARQTFHRFAL